MKPQLTLQDFGGAGVPNSRLLKGGSWKKQRIIVILPTGSQVPAKPVLSWWNLAFPPNNGVCKILAQGMEVGEAYSSAIEGILGHSELSQWEYILTLEHDNTPPQDGILKLLETMEERKDLHVVSGLYFTKGEGGVAQIWGDPADPVLNFRPQVPVLDTVQECCGTGMGFALWRLSLFKDDRLRKPWFKTETQNGIWTQDLYFWSDARKHGIRCAVDTRVRVGHYDFETDITW